MSRPRPNLPAPTPWSFPTFTRTELHNGLSTWGAHIPGKELVCAEVLLPHATTHDPVGKEGLAALAAALLDEGTAERDAEAFNGALELLGATWYASATHSGTSVGVEVPAGNLPAALALLAEALQGALVPGREHERVVHQVLDSMRSREANPSSRAQLAMLGAIWDPSSRAALPGNGTPASVAGITRDDVADLVASYSPRGAHLVVAGDLTGLDVPKLAEHTLGSWGTGRDEEQTRRESAPAQRRRLVVVDRPGSVQSELVLGAVSPTRTHPAWASLQVGSHVLGGTLTSRIDAVLREEKGYTYGMRSGLSPRKEVGSFSISGSVDTGSTLPATRDLLQILAQMEDGVEAAEVEAASSYLVGVAPLRWESPGNVVHQASGLLGAELEPSWIDQYLTGMAEATPASVDAAVAALGLTELNVVVVGDAAQIADGLAETTGLPAEVVTE